MFLCIADLSPIIHVTIWYCRLTRSIRDPSIPASGMVPGSEHCIRTTILRILLRCSASLHRLREPSDCLLLPPSPDSRSSPRGLSSETSERTVDCFFSGARRNCLLGLLVCRGWISDEVGEGTESDRLRFCSTKIAGWDRRFLGIVMIVFSGDAATEDNGGVGGASSEYGKVGGASVVGVSKS